MPVPSLQVSPCNQATGAHPIGHIERVAHESVAYRQPWQQARSLFPPAQETLAQFYPVRLHVCTLAQSGEPVGGLIWHSILHWKKSQRPRCRLAGDKLGTDPLVVTVVS
jgi:hypothetical protein